jgi:hypothetical protein
MAANALDLMQDFLGVWLNTVENFAVGFIISQFAQGGFHLNVGGLTTFC